MQANLVIQRSLIKWIALSLNRHYWYEIRKVKRGAFPRSEIHVENRASVGFSSSYFPRRSSPLNPRRRRNTRSAGMLPRTAAIPRSVAGSRLVSYRGAQGKLTNGIRMDASLGHVSAHGFAICLKSHNAYTSHHHHHHRLRRHRCFPLPTRFPTLFVSTLLALSSLVSSSSTPVKTLSLEEPRWPFSFSYFSSLAAEGKHVRRYNGCQLRR